MMFSKQFSRRRLISTLAIVPVLFIRPSRNAHAGDLSDRELEERFKYLSENGNSTCSTKFIKSIASMPAGARLQGSCCVPMDAHRYKEQIRALRKYQHIIYIPPDPYDVSVELAQKLIGNYDQSLNNSDQAIYDFAMKNSDEKGPCCCECWRWHVYGGLGKYLIQKEKFDGLQLVEVWNLSSGCGGGAEHHH
jgi:hypothetical protein